jgi:hypothetical protein
MKEDNIPIENFGPFSNIPSREIRFAGFPCLRCRKPVRYFGFVVPDLAPRAMLYVCRCASVMVWEDEAQPTSRVWLTNLDLAEAADVDVLIFNGNKPTPPSFQGVN